MPPVRLDGNSWQPSPIQFAKLAMNRNRTGGNNILYNVMDSLAYSSRHQWIIHSI